MTEYKLKHEVFDFHAHGFSQYFCFNRFKVNVDDVIQQHYELRFAPFCIRTESIKKQYIELKFVVFNWYIAIELGKIDG